MSAKRERAEKAGRGGEEEAARWLKEQGWEIIDHRRKTSLGEIDLVARAAVRRLRGRDRARCAAI